MPNTNIDDDLTLLAEQTRIEREGFELYLQTYADMVKPPSMDMMTKLFLVATISVMLLAASRTGFQFFLSGFMSAYKFLSQYISAEFIKTYAFGEAILSILGIEGL